MTKGLKLLHLHVKAPNTVSVDFFRISFTVVVVIRPAKHLIAVLLLHIDKQFFELCFAPTLLNIIKGNNKHSQVIMKVTRLLNIINVTQVGNNRFFPLNLSPLPVLSLLPLPVPCSLPPPTSPLAVPSSSPLQPPFPSLVPVPFPLTSPCSLLLTPSCPFSHPVPSPSPLPAPFPASCSLSPIPY